MKVLGFTIPVIVLLVAVYFVGAYYPGAAKGIASKVGL